MDYAATSKFEALRHPAYFLPTRQRDAITKRIKQLKIIITDILGENNFSINKMFEWSSQGEEGG